MRRLLTSSMRNTLGRFLSALHPKSLRHFLTRVHRTSGSRHLSARSQTLHAGSITAMTEVSVVTATDPRAAGRNFHDTTMPDLALRSDRDSS